MTAMSNHSSQRGESAQAAATAAIEAAAPKNRSAMLLGQLKAQDRALQGLTLRTAGAEKCLRELTDRLTAGKKEVDIVQGLLGERVTAEPAQSDSNGGRVAQALP